ncbi:RNA polymerase sigma factor [Oligoflexus tunisiensis]|uniref:RNA polymerase sigma factor n=1 Tax=Oligoflexus tunisiensis TaxID=708132 RepID=UPI001C40766D|nr:sigma-70 family RNA polymerase sigma factor [Oligoflexus tunisiensis]
MDFQTLYKKHYQAVRAVVSRFKFHDATADDLIQDIFVQAWQNLGSLKEQAAFSGWLMTIARNRCLNELRKTKRTVSVSGTDAISEEDGASGMEVILVADDECASLHFEQSLTLLRQLIQMHEGEPRATVARYFYLEQMSVKEICDNLQMNQNTVLSHLRRFRLIVSQAMIQLAEEKGLEIS